MRRMLTLGVAVLAVCAASVARAGATTKRPIDDWLKNNPHMQNLFRRGFLLNLGWNPHGFPTSDNPDAPEPGFNEKVFDGTDPFGNPGGWNSILADVYPMSEGYPHYSGQILQTVEVDGGVRVVVQLDVVHGPMSVYDRADVLGYPYTDPPWDGCSLAPMVNGPGCYGDNEPPAILGQGPDGWFDYTVQVILHYTPDAFGAAGGKLDCHGAVVSEPKIPFLLAAGHGNVPGVTVEQFTLAGTGVGTFTEYAKGYGFTPGTKGEVAIGEVLSPVDWESIPTIGPIPGDFTLSEAP